MRSIAKKLVCQCILALAMAGALVTAASAQNGTLRSETYYTVKPDRVGDFQAEIKEYNALLVKGGSTRYSSTWLSLTGPRTYVRVAYYSKWADLEAGADPKMKEYAADAARITERILNCTESYRRVIEEINPDVSLPQSSEMPKMVRVLVSQVRPDKLNEYLELQKNEIMPAAKKGGLKDYDFAVTRYGGPSNQVTSVTGVDAWANLDGPYGVEKGLGKEGYQALLGKVRQLISSSQYTMYRFQPDLSYLAPATAK